LGIVHKERLPSRKEKAAAYDEEQGDGLILSSKGRIVIKAHLKHLQEHSGVSLFLKQSFGFPEKK